MMHTTRIGFIGAGNMASCLLGGLIKQDVPTAHLTVSDTNTDQISALQQRYAVTAYLNDNEAVARHSEVLVFAVKPQVLQSVATALAHTVQQRKPLIISVAAGITTTQLARWLGGDVAVVRCMPNTPALLGCGATGLFGNAKVSVAQRQLADQLFAGVGIALWFDTEALLNAVTAVSGSGPGYVFFLMQAMQQAGIELGLASDDARQLVCQTLLGAARMAQATTSSFAELRAQVASPGGTTEQGLQVLAAGQFPALISQALHAAACRADELSKE